MLFPSALTAKLDAMQRDNELLKATLSKLAAEKGPVSPPAPAPVNRDKEKERKRRHAPNSPPAHSVAQAAKADKLVVAEKTAAAVLVSPKPLMSPTKADHSTNSPLDRSISHKDLRAFGGLNDTATFEDVPLDGGNRQTSKSQIGKNAPLGSFLWKKEKEEKIKDDDKKDKKEPKKSKKEEKKDEKKEAQKQDCLKRLGIQSPQGVKAAAKAPDHLTSLAKSTRVLLCVDFAFLWDFYLFFLFLLLFHGSYCVFGLTLCLLCRRHPRDAHAASEAGAEARRQGRLAGEEADSQPYGPHVRHPPRQGELSHLSR